MFSCNAVIGYIKATFWVFNPNLIAKFYLIANYYFSVTVLNGLHDPNIVQLIHIYAADVIQKSYIFQSYWKKLLL